MIRINSIIKQNHDIIKNQNNINNEDTAKIVAELSINKLYLLYILLMFITFIVVVLVYNIRQLQKNNTELMRVMNIMSMTCAI